MSDDRKIGGGYVPPVAPQYEGGQSNPYAPGDEEVKGFDVPVTGAESGPYTTGPQAKF